MFNLVAMAVIERLLNTALYQDNALAAARWRLRGKVLQVTVREWATPVTLVFDERVSVLSQWTGEPDASLTTRLASVAKLRDRNQLTGLIRTGELDVTGDVQVVQHFVALLDLAPWDLTHWLAYGLGDVGAQALSRLLGAGASAFCRHARQGRDYLAQAIVDEWQLSVCKAQADEFADGVAALACDADALTRRLEKLERK